MKKTLLFIATMLFTVMIVNAQGTWICQDTSGTYDTSTELGMGIENLQVMHSDPNGITGHPDETAQTTEYSDIVYDNLAFIQGSTNNMYYTFVTGIDGTLDVSLKMSSAKRTFVLEANDALWAALGSGANDIAALTTGLGTADAIVAEPTFYNLPEVYDTYNDVTKTWDGSETLQETGESQYMVMSFPVSADNTYILGCFGSKAMVRGVNLIGSGSTEPTAVRDLDGVFVVRTEYFNILGHKLIEPTQKGITIVKNTMSNGSIRTSKAVFLK